MTLPNKQKLEDALKDVEILFSKNWCIEPQSFEDCEAILKSAQFLLSIHDDLSAMIELRKKATQGEWSVTQRNAPPAFGVSGRETTFIINRGSASHIADYIDDEAYSNGDFIEASANFFAKLGGEEWGG